MLGGRAGQRPFPVSKMDAMAEDHATRAYRVTGRVQGVGFRWWTRMEAEALGLRGTVRNCEDGSVEVIASGAVADLDRLHSLLRQGPPGARVDAVSEQELSDPAVPLPSSFEILR